MKKYYHMDLEERNFGRTVVSEMQIPYRGSKVLVIYAKTNIGYNHAVVAGVVVKSCWETTPDGAQVLVSEVKPIPPEERDDVRELLRNFGLNLNEEINFW